MNYQIEGPKFKPMILFKEDQLQVGLKHYRYQDITSAEIAYEPSVLSGGIATLVIKGRKVNLSFARKSYEDMKAAVKELREMIKEQENGSVAVLRTAEDMYGFCARRDFKATIRRKQTIADFRAVAEKVKKDEQVLYCFMGHYRKMDQTGRTLVPDQGIVAIAITSQRILAGNLDDQGKHCYSIELTKDIVVTKEKDILFSVLTVENYKEIHKVTFDTQICDDVFEAALKNL